MNTHKDLPSGSQAWARELDDALKEIKHLQGVVQRLADNAGIDAANPRRGLNAGVTPSVKNPVGQKLSSLADVSTYNVLDGQYLTWSQQGQKWLPVTPVSAGTIDISAISYSGLTEGYGTIASPTEYAYNAAGVNPNPFGPAYSYVENWAARTLYLGAGSWQDGPVSLIEMDKDGFGRPYIQISASDYADGTTAYFTVYSYGVRIDNAYLLLGRFATADRPTGLGSTIDDRGAMIFDTDLNIPIWWNGTAWINATGTTV